MRNKVELPGLLLTLASTLFLMPPCGGEIGPWLPSILYYYINGAVCPSSLSFIPSPFFL